MRQVLALGSLLFFFSTAAMAEQILIAPAGEYTVRAGITKPLTKENQFFVFRLLKDGHPASEVLQKIDDKYYGQLKATYEDGDEVSIHQTLDGQIEKDAQSGNLTFLMEPEKSGQIHATLRIKIAGEYHQLPFVFEVTEPTTK